MTSGTFASVPIDQIWVDRERRQRRELPDIPDLAASIAQVGLINPPVIRKDTWELVAGERRLSACRTLGWTHISVQYAEDLPEHELKAIELEENIKRVELPWQDQCRAVQEYHDLRTKLDSEWNQARTAQALGYSKSAITHILSVAQEIVQGNARVVNAERFSVARNIVQRDTERRKSSTIGEISQRLHATVPILAQDFRTWESTGVFNLIHCDFPYGINADNQDQGHNVIRFGGYSDTRDNYIDLLNTLGRGMRTWVADSAHLLFWFSMEHYQLTLDRLLAMGWRVHPYPLVWWKSDNVGLLPDPSRWPRRVYETAFMASRGDRKITSAVANLVAGPTTKEYHMSEKPVNVITHFFRMLVDEYTNLLDPTCGSANALIAAKRLGAHSVLGLEVNPDFVEGAERNWQANT